MAKQTTITLGETGGKPTVEIIKQTGEGRETITLGPFSSEERAMQVMVRLTESMLEDKKL